MNLTEAIKSGKEFKRPRWNYWINPSYSKVYVCEDLIAEDYIIKEEEKKLELTWNQIEDAYKDVFRFSIHPVHTSELGMLKKKLGF